MHRSFHRFLSNKGIKTNGGMNPLLHCSGSAQWTFIQSNIEPKKSTVRKPLAIFVHGTGNDRVFLTYDLFLQLLKNGISIFTFDLDGHGQKGSSLFHEKEILNLFDSWLPLIREQHSEFNLHLIGNSLGGLLSANYLAKNTEHPFQTLTLLATPENIQIGKDVVLPEISTIFQAEYYSYLRRWGIKDSIPALGKFNRKRYPIRFEISSQDHYIDAVSKLSERIPLSKSLKKIDIPVLAIYGHNDFIARPSDDILHLNHLSFEYVQTNHFLLPIYPRIFPVVAQHILDQN